MKPDILMVVVSYNSVKLTRECVESLKAQTADMRFLVWDNASEDGTAQMLAGMDIEYHASPENLYWTPAINQAIEKYSDGETYIGWMNNDATLTPTAVERMVRVLENPDIGLVAPVTSNIGGPQDVANNPEAHTILARGPKFPDRALRELGTKRCTFVLGACSMTRRDVWDTIGPLNADMYLGADDHDLAIRVREHGYEIHVVQSALCQHHGHASSKTNTGRRAWDVHGAKSWAAFNELWNGLYASEVEAIKCHWSGVFDPQWRYGTGWTDAQRAAVGLPPVPEDYRPPSEPPLPADL